MKIKLEGIEFEFDIYDAATAEKYERAIVKIQEEMNNSRADKLSDTIKTQCTLIDEFIDTVIGAGSAEKIFKGTQKLGKHLDAFESIINSVIEQKNAFDERNKRFKDLGK